MFDTAYRDARLTTMIFRPECRQPALLGRCTHRHCGWRQCGRAAQQDRRRGAIVFAFKGFHRSCRDFRPYRAEGASTGAAFRPIGRVFKTAFCDACSIA